MNDQDQKYDLEVFRAFCETDQMVADYLDELTQNIAGPTERSGGLDILFGLATFALYRYVKNLLDRQRGLQNADLRQIMEEEIRELTMHGWSQGEALKTVMATNKAIDQLSPDSGVLQTALAFIERAKRPTSP